MSRFFIWWMMNVQSPKLPTANEKTRSLRAIEFEKLPPRDTGYVMLLDCNLVACTTAAYFRQGMAWQDKMRWICNSLPTANPDPGPKFEVSLTVVWQSLTFEFEPFIEPNWTVAVECRCWTRLGLRLRLRLIDSVQWLRPTQTQALYQTTKQFILLAF